MTNETSPFTRPTSHFRKRDLPQRSFSFALRIVKLCQVLDEKPGVGRTLARQILRSGTSIGANIEEGQAAQSEADYLNKCSIACKEARETLYWLKLLGAAEVLPASRLAELTQECNEIVAILTSITKRLKEKRNA
jgi:four helix bundle protein